jgi:hypothetical protein
MTQRWIILTDDSVSGFSLVPILPDKVYDFSDPTKYPIALALPIIFTDATEGARCLEALERLVGRLTMAGKIAPTTVNNYYPQTDAETLLASLKRLEDLKHLRQQEGPRQSRSTAGGGVIDTPKDLRI